MGRSRLAPSTGLGLHPHVLGGVQRQPGAGQEAELAGPQPGGDHGHLALDRAAVGLDAGHRASRRGGSR